MLFWGGIGSAGLTGACLERAWHGPFAGGGLVVARIHGASSGSKRHAHGVLYALQKRTDYVIQSRETGTDGAAHKSQGLTYTPARCRLHRSG